MTEAPFYAVKMWPGDLGTKGGLVTDEHARVLRPDGETIPGLYAAGNTTASVMGYSYRAWHDNRRCHDLRIPGCTGCSCGAPSK